MKNLINFARLSIGSAVPHILEQWLAMEQFVKILESDPKRIPILS